MPTLRNIMDTETNTENGNRQQMPDIEIPQYDPMVLLEAQTQFAGLVAGNTDMTRLINAFGPVLFATLLYTMSEDYEVDPNDPESLIPRKSAVEAEQHAIGILRGVSAAVGSLDGDLTIEPTDSEVDADTDITPIKDV